MRQSHAARLRQYLLARDITPFIGIYDVFSATVAARHGQALFVRVVRTLASQVGSGFAFSRVAGGAGPRGTLSELRSAGVSLVIYGAPCLFAAQEAMERDLHRLLAHDGLLDPAGEGRVGLAECTGLLRADDDRRIPAFPCTGRAPGAAAFPPCS